VWRNVTEPVRKSTVRSEMNRCKIQDAMPALAG
jgi:hypothetical protein